ncbi:MAG: class I SAM-dependent methyltransferase [Acidimicrobiales bacterium]
MRDWREHWRGIAPETSATTDDCLRQVGKTVLGEPVHSNHIATILATVAEQLSLVPLDVVVDLGCGNGLLTARIADQVSRVVGIDVSDSLIKTARSVNARSNCSYHTGDLAALGELPLTNVSKAYSYEVFQHLSGDEVRSLLSFLLSRFDEGLLFFAGSIPDRLLLHSFYDTPARWSQYQQRHANGTEQIGHWWERGELNDVCSDLGLKCTPTDQAPTLYTSHYRFDAKIEAQ